MDKAALTWRDNVSADMTSLHSCQVLLSDVFGFVPTLNGFCPKWAVSGLFATDGTCVATIQTTILQLAFANEISSTREKAGGIRGVAVHPGWRGHGLFRNLMEDALSKLEKAGAAFVMLYTETPELYRRFGFERVAQHAFVGPAPSPAGATIFRPILGADRDLTSMARLHAVRDALSDRGAVMAAADLFFERVADDGDIQLGMIGENEALVAYEIDGETLTLVDVVAPSIPSLAAILGAMGRSFRTVRTLFPPDKLGWTGTAIDDDTGLMIRGTIPAPMYSFRFPPTTEF